MNKTPETLTNMEAWKLLDRLLTHDDTVRSHKRSTRNHCMALLKLDAGMRVGEVTKLLQSDLIIAGEPVTALCITAEIAKNKTQRIVPLSIRIRASLGIMQEIWWNATSQQRPYYAFYHYFSVTPITPRQVQRIIKRAAITALGRSVHPHVLRHTFASNLMRITNARVVQELLGHKQLSSTQVYCHPNQTDLTNAINDLQKEGT